MSQYLYILCGLPFSGKTTLAKELVRRFGFVRVDLDEINSKRGLGGKSNDEISDTDWKITYETSYRQVEIALRSGKTVINDTANFTRAQRDKLRHIAGNYGIPAKVIYMDIPPELVRHRWQENRKTKLRFDVRDEDFAEVADNFQIPDSGENVIRYTNNLSPDEWIRSNFQDQNI